MAYCIATYPNSFVKDIYHFFLLFLGSVVFFRHLNSTCVSVFVFFPVTVIPNWFGSFSYFLLNSSLSFIKGWMGWCVIGRNFTIFTNQSAITDYLVRLEMGSHQIRSPQWLCPYFQAPGLYPCVYYYYNLFLLSSY